MTLDEERWAEAGQILRWKDDDASSYVAERIATLGAARDRGRVDRFEEIRVKLDGLIHAART